MSPVHGRQWRRVCVESNERRKETRQGTSEEAKALARELAHSSKFKLVVQHGNLHGVSLACVSMVTSHARQHSSSFCLAIPLRFLCAYKEQHRISTGFQQLHTSLCVAMTNLEQSVCSLLSTCTQQPTHGA